MLRLVVGGLAIVLASCAEPEQPLVGEDTLVLELGGEHQLLSEALRAVAPGPRGGRRDVGLPPRTDGPRREALGGTETGGAPPPVDPVPPPEPATREVALAPGQTVSDLAREHLGASRRWGEILALNGWTEEQARRLRVGTMVKLPLR